MEFILPQDKDYPGLETKTSNAFQLYKSSLSVKAFSTAGVEGLQGTDRARYGQFDAARTSRRPLTGMVNTEK